MPQDELYGLLGVEKGATDAEIKKAYRKLARDLHPDRNTANKEAEERFKKMSAAYAVLSDKKKRALYDEFGADGLRDGFDPEMYRRYSRAAGGMPRGAGGGGQDFDMGGFAGFGALEDIFETLFGGSGGRSGRRTRNQADRNWSVRDAGADVRVELEVDFLDAVVGRELQIQVKVGGESRKLKVTLPKGVETGKTLRLKGQGSSGSPGTKAGDMLIEVKVRDDKAYERKGLDLTKKERVTVGQAYHGTTLPVETPWGRVSVTLPPRSQSGQKMRLKGQGIKTDKASGDLYVLILIKLPQKGTPEESSLIDKLEKMYTE